MTEINHLFIASCRSSVECMRAHGMNDVQIGWVLYDVRAAALREELTRIEALRAANPPSFAASGFFIANAIKEEM